MSTTHVADRKREQVYAAERYAFEGTPLADLIDEDDMTNAYHVVVQGAWWKGMGFRPVEIRPANVTMVKWGGKANASLNYIKTSAGRQRRATVSHELAHVLHERTSKNYSIQQAHGATFRRANVIATSAIFGKQYGTLLEGAYQAFNVPAGPNQKHSLPHTPVIDIDALDLATATRGGWKKN
jgi:hypothetical protein